MGKFENSQPEHTFHIVGVRKSANHENIFTIEKADYPAFEHNDKHNEAESNFDSESDPIPRLQQPQQHPQQLETINTFHTVHEPNQGQSQRYCQKLYRNRRQTGSISGGLLLIFVSGLHIGWGIWRTFGWPISTTNMSLLIFSIMAWPLGAIFGGFAGTALLVVLKKYIIYCITAAIMIVGNVLYIAWDRNYAAIVIGRLLISLAHGMVFIVLLTHAAENASKNMRGLILSTINCITFAAIFVAVHITTLVSLADNNNVSVERILGSIAMGFLVASVILTLTVNIETVPHLLAKNEAIIAMENMKRLRDVVIETPELTSEMGEMVLMVARDEQDTRNVFVNGNGKPLVLIIMVRLMAALTNNFLLNVVLIGSCELILYHHRYAPMMIIAPRLGMSIIQIFYADLVGRKIQLIVSSALAGLTLIALGIVLNVLTITDSMNYYVPSLFCMWFQFFAALGIQQMSDAYLAEAFSTAKIWSLPFVMGIEHTFQLFMIGMAFTTITTAGLHALLFISGAFVLIIGIALLFTLPETKGTTLKEARDLFRSEKIFNLF